MGQGEWKLSIDLSGISTGCYFLNLDINQEAECVTHEYIQQFLLPFCGLTVKKFRATLPRNSLQLKKHFKNIHAGINGNVSCKMQAFFFFFPSLQHQR